MPGPRPRGERAMSVAERSAAYWARRKAETEAAGKPVVRGATASRPTGAAGRSDGRTRWRRWRACWTIIRRGGTACPPAWRTARIADRLDELLHLRDAVDRLAAAELPKGFGR